MEGNEMALVNGSNEYWKVYDHAERIYRKNVIHMDLNMMSGLKEERILQIS